MHKKRKYQALMIFVVALFMLLSGSTIIQSQESDATKPQPKTTHKKKAKKTAPADSVADASAAPATSVKSRRKKTQSANSTGDTSTTSATGASSKRKKPQPTDSTADTSAAPATSASDKPKPTKPADTTEGAKSAPATNTGGKTASKDTPRAPKRSVGKETVWVNTATGIYHKKGARYYGNTKEGKYMPEDEAVQAGYKRSKRN
jgi:hypothetical protein